MATMFPRTLRETDCKSAAEVAVFEALQAQLTDERLAFHSVSWLVRNPGAGAEDGEVDFVLVHPDKAVVCLEVKGGKLASRHGRWKRYRHGEWEDARDPSAQALDHRYAVERLIDGVEGWRGKDLLIVHAVAFPDVTVESAMAPDGPREILIDSNDMRALEDAIDRVLAFHIGAREKRKPPGQDGVAMLRELFAKDVELRVPLVQTFRAKEGNMAMIDREGADRLSRRLVLLHHQVERRGQPGSVRARLAMDQQGILAAVEKVDQRQQLAPGGSPGCIQGKIEKRNAAGLCGTDLGRVPRVPG